MKKWISRGSIILLGLSGVLVILQGLQEETSVVQVGHIQIESASTISPSSVEQALAGDGGRLARYGRIFTLSGIQLGSQADPSLMGRQTIAVSAPTEGLLELVIVAQNEAMARELFRLSVGTVQERLSQLESNIPESLQLRASAVELGPVREDYSSRNARLLAGTLLIAFAAAMTIVMRSHVSPRRDWSDS